MMPDGNAEQIRVVADQLADAMVAKINRRTELPDAKIPPPLKWAGGIIAGVFATGVGAMALWLVTTVNEMQVTLARMDERMASNTNAQDSQNEDLARRVRKLEDYHSQGGS